MVHSPLLDSFNPFATHPFTNNSGIIPQPPSPSVYPLPVRSSLALPKFESHQPLHISASTSSLTASSSMESTAQYPESSSRIYTPQPRRYHTASRSPATHPTSPSHVFVPFRKDASSPDLVLKIKSIASASDPTTPTK